MSIKIKTKLKIIVAACLLGFAVTGCEKDVDYTIPQEANTLQDDIDNTFKILSGDNKKWIWPIRLAGNPFNNEGFGLLMEFKKDSSANSELIAKKSLVAQFAATLATGKLTANQQAIARAYSTTFASFTDWNIRNLIINNAANITFLNNTLIVLPNFVHFNPVEFRPAENGFNYNVNGLVQLSLTFTNTTLFPQLKQSRTLDYDFRVFRFEENKIHLNGYYANNANRVSYLHATTPEKSQLFAKGSNLFVPEANLVIGNTTLKINNAEVALPSGYTSALDLFYRSYRQLFVDKAGQFGFDVINNAAILPANLKSSAYYIVSKVYEGNINSIPAGTVIVTLSGMDIDGKTDGKTVEFVKS